MKKIFSISIIVLLLLTAVMLTACDDNGDEHVHAYTEEIVPATCSTLGYTVHTCSECGYVKHDTFVDYDDEVHNFAAVDTVAPTCTEMGYTNFVCSDCDAATKKDNFVNPSHKFGAWETKIEAECPRDGIDQRVCEVCETVEEKTVYATHIWRESETVVTDPTYKDKGYTTYVCICGYVDVRDYTERVITEGLKYNITADEKGYILVGVELESEVLSVPDACVGISGGRSLPVVEIYNYAFNENTSLTSVYISNNISVIGIAAFEGCSNLTSIYFNGTMEEWENITKCSNWDAGTGDYTVYCIDGEIAK